jgi:hypothetical protein
MKGGGRWLPRRRPRRRRRRSGGKSNDSPTASARRSRDDFRSGVDAVEEVEEASNDMRDAIKRRDPVALEEARNALIKALDDNSHYLDNFTNGYADDVRCEAEGVLDTTDEVETEDGQPVAKKKAKKKAKRRR